MHFNANNSSGSTIPSDCVFHLRLNQLLFNAFKCNHAFFISLRNHFSFFFIFVRGKYKNLAHDMIFSPFLMAYEMHISLM